MVSLSEQIAQLRANSDKRISPEHRAVLERHIEQLRGSAIAQSMLKIGDIAPPIALPDHVGRMIHVPTLLEKGPVIVNFYRGGWCPYCNMTLRAFQEVLPEIGAAGATLIAISPEKLESTMSTLAANLLTFNVLSDVDQKVGRAFGLVYRLPVELQAAYRTFGLDISEINGAAEWALPVPATFVINSDSTIIYAHADVDYRNRAEPRDVLATLGQKETAK